MARKIYRARSSVTTPSSSTSTTTSTEVDETTTTTPLHSEHGSIELVKSPSMDSSATSDTSAEDSSGYSLDNFAHIKPTSLSSLPSNKTSSAAGAPPLKRCVSVDTGTSSIRIKKSILKPVQHFEDLNIKEKRHSWKALPKPDMVSIRRRSSLSSSVSSAASEPGVQKRRSSKVGFGDIKVREYTQTIGDHPSVSYGPPITLDWHYEEKDDMTLDDYELARAPRRSLRDMCMNYYQRKNRLMALYGHSEAELKQAKRDAERMQRQRAVTKAFLPWSMLEDAVESAARKTKRIGGKALTRNASV
eukprot:CAMPEP_0194036700 /NCGR_PEP_ID=MMETSP0009_2-20130614/9067_1 /TAXON_ID=210454 /ORGANISM="Grammatophora oceanica, Strain CCMP 410" /LENGTH=302 /DNA_ID=CAMNT_0038678569 /DNA_START=117 /DNA_END=1025 /DNA_ORIENTATION=+